jgi:hypothetical protein
VTSFEVCRIASAFSGDLVKPKTISGFCFSDCLLHPQLGGFHDPHHHADPLVGRIPGHSDEFSQKSSTVIHQRSNPPCCIPGQVTHLVDAEKADTDGVRIVRVVWLPIQGKGADVNTAPFEDIELTVVISDTRQFRVKWF